MGRILVGISSWAEPELVKCCFYPVEIKTPEDRLKYYASHFSVAEIDASYHYFPARRSLELWRENTPAGFVFDVRAFSLFTGHPTPLSSFPRTFREKYADRIRAKGNVYPHHLPPDATDELWAIFKAEFESYRVAGKVGGVLFQMPPWFHPEPKNYDYLEECRKRISPHQMAVEFRVGSWLAKWRDVTLNFLTGHKIALVCVDEPQGFRSSVPPVAETTAPLAIIRFHGRNRETWEARDIRMTEKFNYLYSEEELQEWLPKIKAMAAKTDELHVIFKNKHADFPTRNAARMKELLGMP